MIGLDMNTVVQIHHFGQKVFRPQEKHCCRHCREDVILLMEEGILHFTEDGQDITLKAGEYYIQRRGLYQEGKIPSPGAVYDFIHVLGEYCENPAALPLRGQINEAEIAPHLRLLRSYSHQVWTQTEVCGPVCLILTALKRGVRESETKHIVRRLMEQIGEAPQREWTLEALSHIAGYSKNHLITLFREECGYTPHAYIREIRMRAARTALMHTDDSLSAISEACGFGPYVNFYKAFRSQYGISPQSWRDQYRDI